MHTWTVNGCVLEQSRYAKAVNLSPGLCNSTFAPSMNTLTWLQCQTTPSMVCSYIQCCWMAKLIVWYRPCQRRYSESLRDPNCCTWLPGCQYPTAASKQDVRRLAPFVLLCLFVNRSTLITLSAILQTPAHKLSLRPFDLILGFAHKSSPRNHRLYRPRSQP